MNHPPCIFKSEFVSAALKRQKDNIVNIEKAHKKTRGRKWSSAWDIYFTHTHNKLSLLFFPSVWPHQGEKKKNFHLFAYLVIPKWHLQKNLFFFQPFQSSLSLTDREISHGFYFVFAITFTKYIFKILIIYRVDRSPNKWNDDYFKRFQHDIHTKYWKCD